MTNVLLTGSGGFIGKNLKKYLKDKFNLLTPRSFELDLTDEKAVKEYFENNSPIDFIIHCGSIGGARGIEDEELTIEKNLAMFDNLTKYKKEKVRIITFGSGAMYGKSRNLHKVKEKEIGDFIPLDLYGQSKLELSKKVKTRDDTLMLNIFACYGYDELETRFPSYAINQALKNEDIIINQNVIFDYLFVEDMEKIVEHFIQNKPNDKIINITPNDSISLKEIAKIVREISNKDIKIEIKNPVMNNEYTGCNELLKKNFPQIKFTNMEDGLKRLYNYKQQLRSKNEG